MLVETGIIQTLKDEPKEWQSGYVACGDKRLKAGLLLRDCGYIPSSWAPRRREGEQEAERAYKWTITQCGSSPTHLHTLSTCTHAAGVRGIERITLQVCTYCRDLSSGGGGMNQFDSSDTNKLPALSSQRSRVSPDLCSAPVSLHCTLDSLVSGQFCQRPLMTCTAAKVCPPILLLISVCKSVSLFAGVSITCLFTSTEFRWDKIRQRCIKMYNSATTDYFYYCFIHLLRFLIKR